MPPHLQPHLRQMARHVRLSHGHPVRDDQRPQQGAVLRRRGLHGSGGGHLPPLEGPPGTTWARRQAELLPRHAWVVLDHNDGPDCGSFGVAVAVSAEFVWVGGRTTFEHDDAEPTPGRRKDRGGLPRFVTLEGEPVSIRTFPGSKAEQPNGLAVSADGYFLSMVGYFRGTLTLGSEEYRNNVTRLTDEYDCGTNCPKDAFLAKISAADSSVAWSVHFPHQGDASTELFATAVTAAGDIVYGGHITNTGRPHYKRTQEVLKSGYCFLQNTCFEDGMLMPPGDVVCLEADEPAVEVEPAPNTGGLSISTI